MKHPAENKTLLWLWKAAGQQKWRIGLLMLLQLLLGASSILFALLLSAAVDSAVEQVYANFLKNIGALTAVVLFQLAARACKRYLDERIRSGLENSMKKQLFSTLLVKDYACVTAVHSGEWLNRLTSDTTVVADGMVTIAPDVLEMLVKLFGALAAILMLIPQLGWVLIPGGFLLLLVSYLFRQVLKKLHKEIREADGKTRILLSERLSALMVIRSFGKEVQSIRDVETQMQHHHRARLRRNRFSNFCNIGFGAVMNGLYLAGVGCCGYGILTGSMSYGTFTAVLQLIGHIQQPFANITGYLPKFYAMLASAERLMEAEQLPGGDADRLQTPGKMRRFYTERFLAAGLDGVSFTYQPPANGEKPEMPLVLKNITMYLQKGEFVAVTGDSGCGKTTLLKLLMNLYRPDAGHCWLRAIDGEKCPMDSSFTRLFAYVPQGNCLMCGSIRQILTFSDRERMYDDDALYRALEIACAAEFVRKLPAGLDTQLGERGAGLSEGQLQRLAIARAVFSENPILVLDEATSALDEAAERKLLGNLRAMTDRTVLIVTHRPAALELCDRQLHLTRSGMEEIVSGKK